MRLTENELDNILMAQKDWIYGMFNTAVHTVDDKEVLQYFRSDILKIKLILNLIQFNHRLWSEASYGYKGQEILRRIEVTCRNTRDTLHHAASAKRDDLDNAIAKCNMLSDMFPNIRGNKPHNPTPPTMTEQVCGLGGGIDNGPICHDDRPAHNSLAAQIAAIESGNVIYQ